MDKLEDRVAALEVAITTLRVELETQRTRIRTMRDTHQCASCGGKRILHFRRINESGGRAGLIALSLNTTYKRWLGTHQEGDPLEAYVCRACGLLEWHATGLDAVKPDGVNIVEIGDEPTPSNTEPYR
ncbi:MAG TPA: hypothetical protein VIV40_44710 [Kofleriaceae bacterium]